METLLTIITSPVFLTVVITLCVCGIILAVSYLKNMGYFKNISEDDLKYISKVTGIAINFVYQLPIKNSEEIKKITNAIMTSLQLVIVIFDGDDTQIKEQAFKSVISMCNDMNIKINEDKENLIRTLIDVTYKNNFKSK